MPKYLTVAARFAVALAALAIASPLSAQGAGSIVGIVTDSSGAPIYRAEVAVEGSDVRAHSDVRGRFALGSVPLGTMSLTARRLGFLPVKVPVQVSRSEGASVAIRMMAVATTLRPVVVHPTRTEYSGRLAGYYERLERRVTGYFITREEIDRDNPTTLSQVLQTVPGIHLGRARGGITGMRMRGRSCWPLVWLDGTPMPAGETDMDAIVPSSVQGIELYLGSTTAPIQYIYNRDLSSCGTVLIWSRGPDTDPIGAPSSSADLEGMIARRAVYSADRVDQPAHLDDAHPLHPQFPPSLFAARVQGLVIAQFVVDTLGTVADSTVEIVSSTDPLFSDAVRAALHGASYIPARKDGHPVRQIVQQPFRFDAGG